MVSEDFWEPPGTGMLGEAEAPPDCGRGGGWGLVLSKVSERMSRNSGDSWMRLKAVRSFSCGAVKVMLNVLVEIVGAFSDSAGAPGLAGGAGGTEGALG